MISAVLVSYRSAAEAAGAAASLRREASREAVALEVVVVVNSGDEREAEALSPVADRLLFPGRNLGYAGGLNAGIDAASGDALLLCNADVLFLPRSLGLLLEALPKDEPVLCGPAFYADEGATLLHPPAEEPRPPELARRRLEGTPRGRDALFRREARRVLSARRVVSAGAACGATALRGAVMLASRAAVRRAGPLDEGYPLYYEENDWQRRLRLSGGRLVWAAGSAVVHRYDRSARGEPRAREWFARSERRYFVSHFGERGQAAVEAQATAGPDPPEPVSLPPGGLPLPRGREVAVAFSPRSAFRPFLLAVPPGGAGTWSPPDDVVAGLGDSRWYARAFDTRTLETLSEGSVDGPVNAVRAAPSASTRE